ncbi:unnamed protein product [Porites lobata]|uniref:Uncharacterized protein n=1 Tax=Porites lobata TaxID=104759 RepID=A0ABN8MQ00_9CNID|nr:unnamed protein product [Porites lobata]
MKKSIKREKTKPSAALDLFCDLPSHFKRFLNFSDVRSFLSLTVKKGHTSLKRNGMLFIVYQGKRKMNTFVVQILSVFVLLSGVSGVRHGGDQANDTSPDISNEKCPLQLNTKLPGVNCSLPDDYFCGQITCSALFSHLDIKLTIEIFQIDDWPSKRISAYISLSVPDRLTWSHSFSDGETFKVPGFPLKVEGFEGADVFLHVSLKKENRTIYFKVLIAMAVCALVFFLIVIATFYYLCKKKKVTAGQVKPSKPPSYEEATSIKNKVPLQPLINEV